MKAILCEQPGILTLMERTRPVIREGEVLSVGHAGNGTELTARVPLGLAVELERSGVAPSGSPR